MCGIAAVLAPAGPPPTREELERMASALEHRGPDDIGFHLDGTAGLAHHRLSIIDIAGGHQPFSNEDGTVWITFNGEIYNFAGLRALLVDRGHVMKSRSDTEVLVHLYEEKGPEMVHDLRGVFAFVIWDAKRRRLFAARDRYGEKPLVWAERDGRYYFASEMASLLAALPGDRKVDRLGLYRYLCLQSPIAPRTILEGVNRLPAAHHLTIEDGRVAVRRYWDLPLPDRPLPEREAEEELWSRFVEVVKLQQVSERPLGFYLSGGIDSTLVVAAAREAGIADIKTYCVTFPGTKYDESAYAAQAARRFETEHQAVEIDFDVAETLPLLMKRYGEPFGDPSCVPTYAVARAAKRHVTVVLSGDGGDELTGGYHTYLPLQAARPFRLLPSPWRAAISATAAALGRPDGRSSADRLVRLFSVLALGPADRSYAFWRTRYPMAVADELLLPGARPSDEEIDAEGPRRVIARAADVPDPVEGARRADIRVQLADVFCPKSDISSSANALEVRSPFLDPALGEWAERRLPASARVRGRQTKRILKRLLGRFLPPEFVHRKKQGFTPPYDEWFRGKTGEWSRAILLSERARARGWFRPEVVTAMLDRHASRQVNVKESLFILLAAEVWAREFLDGTV